jgi:hypothetical protein
MRCVERHLPDADKVHIRVFLRIGRRYGFVFNTCEPVSREDIYLSLHRTPVQYYLCSYKYVDSLRP